MPGTFQSLNRLGLQRLNGSGAGTGQNRNGLYVADGAGAQERFLAADGQYNIQKEDT